MAEFLASNGKYLAVLLGVIAVFPLVWRKRKLLKMEQVWQVLIFEVVVASISMISAMLFASIEELLSNGSFSFGAISTYGIYLLSPFFFFILCRVMKWNTKDFFDVFAFCVPPALFFLRCSCLLSGCCGGRPIPGFGSLCWPTREAELVFYAAMLLFLLRRERKAAPPGTAFPLLMACYGAFRFVEEWFRKGSGASLVHLAHLWSIIALIVGLGLYFELSKTSQKERRSSKC